MLSESMPYEKKFIDVNGRKMAYFDEGSGDPIVLYCTVIPRPRSCGATLPRNYLPLAV